MKNSIFKVFALILLLPLLSLTNSSFQIAKLKYNGGGDWYANKTSLPNLIQFCNKNLNMNIGVDEAIVDAGSNELFNYPFIHMTGHGNVVFSTQEAENLRKYLIGGGFLHIDDNYGMDKFIRPEMKKIFPELKLIEIPFSHPVYHQKYNFFNGLPKIHEHEGKSTQGFGYIYEGRLVLFYSFECDLGNGWEDQGIYPEDTPESHQKALQMGANLIQYSLTH